MTMNNYPSRSSQKAIKMLVVISRHSYILQANVRLLSCGGKRQVKRLGLHVQCIFGYIYSRKNAYISNNDVNNLSSSY